MTDVLCINKADLLGKMPKDIKEILEDKAK
jgi:hypothetical protein